VQPAVAVAAAAAVPIGQPALAVAEQAALLLAAAVPVGQPAAVAKRDL
jgi:hypothetical protein